MAFKRSGVRSSLAPQIQGVDELIINAFLIKSINHNILIQIIVNLIDLLKLIIPPLNENTSGK